MNKLIGTLLILAATSCHPSLSKRDNEALCWTPDGLAFNDTLSSLVSNDLECRIWTNKLTFNKSEEPKLGISIVNHSNYNIVLPSGFNVDQGVPKATLIVSSQDGSELPPFPYAICGNMDCVDSTYYRRVGPGQEIVLFDYLFHVFPPILRPAITSKAGPVKVKLKLKFDSAKPDTSYWYMSTYVWHWMGLQYENVRPELSKMIPPGHQDLIDKIPRVELISNEIEILFK